MMTILRSPSKIFLPLAFLAMVFSASFVQAQQTGVLWENTSATFQNWMPAVSFDILDYSAPGCESNSEFYYSVALKNQAWGTPSGPNVITYPSLPGGSGENEFTVRTQYKILANGTLESGLDGYVRQNPIAWDMYVNGVLCEDCFDLVTVVSGNMGCGSYVTQDITFTHNVGSWANNELNDGIYQISLRPVQMPMAYGCFQVCNCTFLGVCCGTEDAGWTDYSTTTNGTPMEEQAPEFRFNAVFTGTTFTDTIGTFDTPQALTCILRDPPGDQSYGEWAETTNQCFGTTTYGGTGTESSQWSKVTLGLGGSLFGLGYEVNSGAGISTSISNETTNTNDYLTCIETTEGYITGIGDTPDDIFIGSSLTYVYGMARTVYWEDCVLQYKDGFAMSPVSTNSTFVLAETAIRTIEIPGLEADIANFEEFSEPWEDATEQLNQWQQALDLNDQIKEEATGGITRTFNSTAGSAVTYSKMTTTSQTKSIDMKVRLSNGLDFDYGASIGCCEVLFGGEFNIRTEFGSTATASNVYENTMSYSLGDDDNVSDEFVDNFIVQVMDDPVFGSYVFELLEGSSTSCPYEGGNQIEQPQIWIGAEGQSAAAVQDVPVGTTASVPIWLCNNTLDRPVNYVLSVNSSTNAYSAALLAYGEPLSGTSQQTIPIPPNTCQAVPLSIEQTDLSFLDYEDIEIKFSSDCEPDIISSSAFISVYFNNSLGVNDMSAAKGWFTVSPNPSSGIFNLIPKGVQSPMSYTVTDLAGRTVLQNTVSSGSGNIEVNLSHVSSGMYVLVAEKDGNKQSTKLIVRH